MLYFKFHQNRPINEEFDCWGFKGPRGFQGAPISKNQKSLIQNGGPNTHPKFQHSSSIRKCLKMGGTDLTFRGVKSRPSSRGRGTGFQKFKKASYRTVVQTHTENFSTPAPLGCIQTSHVREK